MADKDTRTETVSRATNDAYTGMLVISLAALIVGCVLLYLDYAQYDTKEPAALPPRPKIGTVETGGDPTPKDGAAPDDKKDKGKKGDGGKKGDDM